jgi:hypothetical protein
MDPRWQPPLEHPRADVPVTAEARGLYAAGWHADMNEGRIVNLASQLQQIVSPPTWHALRELGASIPPQLNFA